MSHVDLKMPILHVSVTYCSPYYMSNLRKSKVILILARYNMWIVIKDHVSLLDLRVKGPNIQTGSHRV